MSAARIATVARAQRRLRLVLVTFFLALLLPLSFLVWRVYQQLQVDTFYQYRTSAEEIVARIESTLIDVLRGEEERPFDHYSFFSVDVSELLAQKQIGYSPLSSLKPSTSMPGVHGFFQVDPDGSFHTPFLPDVDKSRALQMGIGAGEYEQRLQKRDALYASLRGAPFQIRGIGSALSAQVAPSQQARPEDDLQSEQQTYGQKLSALQLDTGLYQKQSAYGKGGKSIAQKTWPRKTKKAESNFAYNSLWQSRQVGSTTPESEAQLEQVPAASALNKDDSVFNVLAFEAEIDPFQFATLPNGRFLFFRTVWRNQQRYIQGIVVSPDEFLSKVILSAFEASRLAGFTKLIVAYQDQVLRSIETGAGKEKIIVKERYDEQKERLLYKTKLIPPLDQVDLVFSIGKFPAGREVLIVDMLVVVLFLVLSIGLILFYRLALGHILLAKQRGDFVSAVSHELKTPLTSIRMYGEMLRAGWVKDDLKKKEYYDFIFFESERLSRLINNVLQLAKLTRSELALDLHSVQAGTLLDMIQSKVSSMVENADFELVMEQGSDLKDSELVVDEDAVAQIFINLVDNALKFSKDALRKEVRIALSRVGQDNVAISVRDYGPGIDRGQAKKIFQLFYRVGDELTRTTPGTGIGLALVNELARAMSARIELRNCEPGVEFQVIFPLRS